MIQLIKKEYELGSVLLPFFGQEKYLKTKSPNYGWFVSEKFVLPFTLFKKLLFKRIVFTTDIISINENQTINDEKEFLNDIIEFIKKHNICDFIHKPQPSVVFKTYPENSNAYRWGSYIMNTNCDLNILINGVTASQERTNIRSAIKAGVVIKKTDDYEEIYAVCNDTLSRQKIPLLINKEEFTNQYKTLYPKNMLLFKAVYNNIIQGAMVIFYDHENAVAEYSGSVNKAKNGALPLLYLSSIQCLAKDYNIKSIDFIGAIPDIIEDSKEARIQRFKKRLGSNLKEGYQFTVIINPIKYFLFNLLLKARLFIKGVKYIDPVERDKRLSKTRLEI